MNKHTTTTSATPPSKPPTETANNTTTHPPIHNTLNVGSTSGPGSTGIPSVSIPSSTLASICCHKKANSACASSTVETVPCAAPHPAGHLNMIPIPAPTGTIRRTHLTSNLTSLVTSVEITEHS